jgi:hypothetical protein
MGYKGVVNNLQGGGVSVLSANHIAVTADFTSATWNIFSTPKHRVRATASNTASSGRSAVVDHTTG